MRKLALILGIAVAVAVVLVPGTALANFAIHGGYALDTDECASCHRAHTAPSAATWVNTDGETRSALLLSTATTVEEFCVTCHGVNNEGAETNVVEGIYEGDDYGTNSDPLLGGAFGADVGEIMPEDFWGNSVSSSHMAAGSDWGAYGGGPDGLDLDDITIGTGGNDITMTCTSCHDPHGSSNYRILKDYVYGGEVTGDVRVGGYTDPDTPTPFVISCEEGYPLNGFRLHANGAADMAGYTPNYTVAQYSYPPAGDVVQPYRQKGMSGWCAGCHTQYVGADRDSYSSVYDANDGFGMVTRHRHPMNTELSNYAGARALVMDEDDMTLPVAHDPATEAGSGGVINVALDTADMVECLTCHNAHGATSEMEGWAADTDPVDPELNYDPLDWEGNPKLAYEKGVPPAGSPALLKLDNRGTCEMCHDK